MIASEGMYIIRKLKFNTEKIIIDEDKFYEEFQDVFNKCQDDAIEKYGDDFTSKIFYGEIAQDKEYIDRLNCVLNKYRLQIDYYPRIKDKHGYWIIETVYLPVYVIESYKT